jgi:hypothetical protein
MSRMKRAMDVVNDLRSLADSIETLTKELQEQHVADVVAVREPATEEKKPTFKEVRAALAALSKSGMQKEVKELITTFGAKKLSDIPEDKYSELLQKAGEL